MVAATPKQGLKDRCVMLDALVSPHTLKRLPLHCGRQEAHMHPRSLCCTKHARWGHRIRLTCKKSAATCSAAGACAAACCSDWYNTHCSCIYGSVTRFSTSCIFLASMGEPAFCHSFRNSLPSNGSLRQICCQPSFSNVAAPLAGETNQK